MNRQDLLDIIKTFPDTPGVYFFKRTKGEGNDILYIGKATNLRSRVRSYFSTDIANTRGPKIVGMLESCDTITFEKTDSVLEALLLESHLIKKYQPAHNTLAKDDKSNLYVVITKEDFPQVLTVRGRDMLKTMTDKSDRKKLGYSIAHTFGPFPYGYTLREAMKIIRRIFPYRDAKCIPAKDQKNPAHLTPCFNRQIGLCPGVCTGEISAEEYGETIQNIVRFFEGNKKAIIKNLEKRMKECAKEQKFEEATILKKQLFALTHIHDVSLIREETWGGKEPTGYRIESYDIAHLMGQYVVGVMTVVEDGSPAKGEYRKFKIKENPGINDTKALSEVLSRRLGHNEWRFPNLIVVDGGIAQKRAIEKVLRETGNRIPVVSVVKDERHKPKEILGDKMYLKYEKEILLSNAEAHRFAIGFHKEKRDKNWLTGFSQL
jgi:excinuclease ABC subunit C